MYINICSYGENTLGTPGQVRNSRGKRTIGVRAIEVSVYIYFEFKQKGQEFPYFAVSCYKK